MDFAMGSTFGQRDFWLIDLLFKMLVNYNGLIPPFIRRNVSIRGEEEKCRLDG